MNTPHYTKIHNRFQLKGYYFSADELKDLGYDFIKEGVPYEVAIGKFIMEGLSYLDKVAYVRFASVYKNFKEAKDFEQFVGNLDENKS